MLNRLMFAVAFVAAIAFAPQAQAQNWWDGYNFSGGQMMWPGGRNIDRAPLRNGGTELTQHLPNGQTRSCTEGARNCGGRGTWNPNAPNKRWWGGQGGRNGYAYNNGRGFGSGSSWQGSAGVTRFAHGSGHVGGPSGPNYHYNYRNPVGPNNARGTVHFSRGR